MSEITRPDAIGGYSTAMVPGAREHDRAQALRALIGDRSVVYAFRLADGTIKIGWTNNITQRRNFFAGAEIAGFMFGGYTDEQRIHDRLSAHVHHGREFYNPSPEVLAVVNEWREPFGLTPLAA